MFPPRYPGSTSGVNSPCPGVPSILLHSLHLCPAVTAPRLAMPGQCLRAKEKYDLCLKIPTDPPTDPQGRHRGTGGRSSCRYHCVDCPEAKGGPLAGGTGTSERKEATPAPPAMRKDRGWRWVREKDCGGRAGVPDSVRVTWPSPPHLHRDDLHGEALRLNEIVRFFILLRPVRD